MVEAGLGFGVRTNHRTTLEGVENFGGVETEHGQVAVPEHAAATVPHAKGMGSVIDQLEAVLRGNRRNGGGVARTAVAMHRQDRRHIRSDGGLNAGRIEIERLRIDVREARRVAVPQQRVRSGDKGKWRGDHLAGDLQAAQGGNQCDGAVVEQGDVVHSEVAAQRLLKPLVKRPAIGEQPAVPDLLQIRDELRQGRQVWLGDIDRAGAHDTIRKVGHRSVFSRNARGGAGKGGCEAG